MALRRLVTSAATIAMLGCSADGASEGTSPPPFGGLQPTQPADTPPVDTAGTADPAANGAGQAPVGGQAASEGQNPDNIGIDNTGAQPGGGDAPTDTGASEQVDGVEQPGAEQPPVEEPGEPTEEPVEPEPVPEEPAPIVRPALDCGAPPPQLANPAFETCEASTGQSVGGQDAFFWYNEEGPGGCMRVFDTPAGAFTANWNNPVDVLARIGPWFDETQTHQEVGEIVADLAFTKQGSGGSYSFIGIYGWTLNPIIEFYIVEDDFPGAFNPPFGTNGRGAINVDGATYDVYTGNRVNQFAITGNRENFLQVFSVRRNKHQCGRVSISEHFRQWESMGIDLGLMKEAKIVVEAGGGNGSVTFHHANVTVTPPN